MMKQSVLKKFKLFSISSLTQSEHHPDGSRQLVLGFLGRLVLLKSRLLEFMSDLLDAIGIQNEQLIAHPSNVGS